MKKEFTVGDMIKVLQKLDKDLPLYDHFYDDETEAECWFNVAKPTPKKQTIYLRAKKVGKKILGEWTDEKYGDEVLETKKVVMLYPPDKNAIEIS